MTIRSVLKASVLLVAERFMLTFSTKRMSSSWALFLLLLSVQGHLVALSNVNTSVHSCDYWRPLLGVYKTISYNTDTWSKLVTTCSFDHGVVNRSEIKSTLNFEKLPSFEYRIYFITVPSCRLKDWSVRKCFICLFFTLMQIRYHLPIGNNSDGVDVWKMWQGEYLDRREETIRKDVENYTICPSNKILLGTANAVGLDECVVAASGGCYMKCGRVVVGNLKCERLFGR